MFDELRIKRLLKKEITSEIYKELPLKIKNDSRIIEKFISSNPNNINYVSVDKIIEIVKNNYDLFENLNNDVINDVFLNMDISKINIDKELFSNLNVKNRDFVFKYNPKLYFNLIPNEVLVIEFPRMISDMINKKEGYFYSSDSITDPEKLKDILLSLEPEKIVLIAEKGTINSNKYVNQVINSLTKEEQMNLYNSNDKIFPYLSTELQGEIQISKCEGDIEKISNLPEHLQLKYFSKNIESLKYASDKLKEEVFKNGGFSISAEQFREITYNSKYRLGYYMKYMFNFLQDEEILNLLNGGGKNVREYTWGFMHQKEEITNLINLVKLRLSSIEDVDKRNDLMKIFLSVVKTNDDLEYYDSKGIKITSMLLDEKIIQNNDAPLLEKYSKEEDRETFVTILSNAYGEHVREIFASRPMLNYYEVPNFKIFEQSIVDNLGIEFINYVLTYDYSSFSYELSLIATKPEKMAVFKKIWDYSLARNEKVDAGTIYEIMNNFCVNEELLSKLDLANMSEEQKKKFDLFLIESDNTKNLVNSIDDIDNYLNIRNELFSKKIDKSEKSYEIREYIFEYLTGRVVNTEIASIETMGIDNVVEVFNVNNIIRNPGLVQSIGLNDDEVALLLLVNQVRNINNEQVLKDIFLSLSNSKELNPLSFKGTFDKISDYYVDKFKNELTDNEELEKMPQTVVEGVPVINFEGEPFNLLCSVTGLDFSMGRYSGKKTEEDLLSNWLNIEDGMSTISCTLCSSDITINPTGTDINIPNITFVFDSDVDVVGMGGSDISISHTKREARHSFEYIGHNKMKFATMDEIKKDALDSINEMKKSGMQKFPSEIGVLRREEDIRKVENSQKRKMPIGIYVMGEVNEEVLNTAKKFQEYYKNNGLGEFKIIKINPEKYKSASIYDYVQTPTEKIKSNVSWYNDAEEQINKGR